ncbi:MAG: FHA domain-containing protein [Anaerolineales bacterium]|nr:FHA domain-containing protein [Anaerolineales bacterium]
METKFEETPLLIAQTGPLEGQRWLISNRIIIGRDPSCNIIISDRQVSRQHVRISPTASGILLEDLGSKNGTHLNGVSLQKSTILQDADNIQIAFTQQFTYLISDATMPLDEEETDYQPIKVHLLRLEKRSRRVWIGNHEVLPPLSVSQFKLLEVLYAYQGRVVPRRKLIETVWGEEQAVDVSEQALDALVRRLRDRLAIVDSSHSFIITIRGHGLRLDNPPID